MVQGRRVLHMTPYFNIYILWKNLFRLFYFTTIFAVILLVSFLVKTNKQTSTAVSWKCISDKTLWPSSRSFLRLDSVPVFSAWKNKKATWINEHKSDLNIYYYIMYISPKIFSKLFKPQELLQYSSAVVLER